MNQEILDAIEAAKKAKSDGSEYTFEERDVILYNLGIGAKRSELPYIFEGHESFQALPTFGVIPYFGAQTPFDIAEIVPNFNPMLLLHGEQFLKISAWPLPTSGTLVSYPKLLEVVDKGSAAIVKTCTTTCEKESGKEVFYNESTIFIRKSGGFGGPKQLIDRGASTAPNAPPKRAPDAVVESPTSEEQAAIYRLSGDYNPLHVDPEFAAMGGFEKPILHGLCSLGIAGKAVYEKYGPFKTIKTRFAGTVIPGQTLVTEMWREGGKVVFQAKVKETGKPALASAAVELLEDAEKSKL